MPMRSAGALVALFVAVASGACASQGAGEGGGDPGDEDAGSSGGSDAGGPSPDAIVFGFDASAGQDGAGGGVDTGTADDSSSDPPDVADDSSASKSCAGLPDGTVCGASPDICHDAPVCASGACAAAAAKADGFVCASAPDDCHTDGTCKSGVCGAVGTRADGYNWSSGDATAVCCSAKPIHTDTDTDCGACGIKCNASNGESCSLLGGHYFCRGCVASAACWSGCCSESFTPYSCAASDCAGNCDSAVCPAGSHCVSGAPDSSDYCSY